ncbi:hypothetical protein [Pseudomonas sp. GL-R-19]|uniref:hypothetical protein n=1 Tax=Pseudomonas sp. GL-R-19 TaxID=2832391 RepID=UPI003989B90F
MNVLLIVDAVFFHHPLQVRLKHPGHLNLEATDSFRCIVRRFLLAFLALFDGFRRRPLLFLGHGLPLQFRGPVDPAMSVVGAGAPGC